MNGVWFRQNLADAMRQDEKVDRKIARNQNQFEALDFNAAVSDTRMSPASAFVATIRGNAVTPFQPGSVLGLMLRGQQLVCSCIIALT